MPSVALCICTGWHRRGCGKHVPGQYSYAGLSMRLQIGEAEPELTFVKASSFEPHTMESIYFGKIPQAKWASVSHTLYPVGRMGRPTKTKSPMAWT